MVLDSDGNILLNNLLRCVEKMTPLHNHIVSYYSELDKAFVNVGMFPIDSNYSIQ